METDDRGGLTDRDSKMASSFESAVDTKSKKKSKKAATPPPPMRAHEELAASEEKKSAQTEKTEEAAVEEPKKGLLDLFQTQEPEPEEKPEPLAEAEQLLGELDDPLEALAPDADPEELSDPEKQAVAQQIIAARRQELGQELHSAPEDQEEEILTNAAFIDNLEDLVAQTGELNDEILDHATGHTMAEFDLPEAETAKPTEAMVNEVIQEVGGAEAPDEPEDFDTTLPVTAARSAAPPITPPPPMPLVPSPDGGGNYTFGAGGNYVPPGPDIAMPVASPNVIAPRSKGPEQSPDRHSRAGDMLVGGVVGYLIGRRRGRIRAEERLVPIQQKLEHEVKDMQQKIGLHETRIRTLTSEKIAREGVVAREAVAQKMEAKARPPEPERVPMAVPLPEAAPIPIPVPEVAPIPIPLPEIPRAERVGAVLLPHAEIAPLRPELSPIVTSHVETAPKPALTKESVRIMPEAELLQVAAKVEVAGTSAKALYEQGRIGKEDLRTAVSEYAAGNKNYESILLEKLHDVPPESMEFLSPGVGKPDAKDAGGASGGGGDSSGAPVPDQPLAHQDSYTSNAYGTGTPAATPAPGSTPPPPKPPISQTAWISILAFTAITTIFVLFLFF
jgi:hypothetical protein